MIDEVQSVISNWKKYADNCGVTKICKNKIANALKGKV
jgi:hypothetical protein